MYNQDIPLTIASLKPRSPKQLNEEQADAFATALDVFSRKVWRKQREPKAARYDLAILVEPDEKMPPSNKGALERFVRAGKELGIDCEFITQRDYLKLPEYDGLFIRTTTNIDHYTYRFAKRAESEVEKMSRSRAAAEPPHAPDRLQRASPASAGR